MEKIPSGGGQIVDVMIIIIIYSKHILHTNKISLMLLVLQYINIKYLSYHNLFL